MMACICNSSTLEAEAGESKVRGQQGLHSELEFTTDYIARILSQKKRKMNLGTLKFNKFIFEQRPIHELGNTRLRAVQCSNVGGGVGVVGVGKRAGPETTCIRCSLKQDKENIFCWVKSKVPQG
jgi:hypothetical protein